MSHKVLFVALLVALALGASVMIVDAQGPKPGGKKSPFALAGTGFTYQGQLKNSGALVNSMCDFQFGLWDASSAGAQVGTTQTIASAVTNGLFTVQLNASGEITTGTAFNGDSRYLASAVRCPSGGGSYTALNPRQALTPAPMAFALPGLYTQQNVFSPNIIGGYSGNIITPTLNGATISGGGQSGFENRAWNDYAAIGGGFGNTASGYITTIGGGQSNTASGPRSTIGGGQNDTASGDRATVGGGYQNAASNLFATVGGGGGNTASGNAATVGGGSNNAASNDYATVGGGGSNTAYHNGVFVWTCDACDPTSSSAPNQFLVSASGGITMYTSSDLSLGVTAQPGSGSWSSVSDRNLKANFAPTNNQEILTRLVAIPVQTWNYKTQDASIRHIGPMAQDFYASFNVGEDDRHITTIDSEGVALAAIQGLYQVTQEKDAKIEKLKAQSEKQQAKIEELEARLTTLEQANPSVRASAIPSPDANAFAFGALLLSALALYRTQRKGAK